MIHKGKPFTLSSLSIPETLHTLLGTSQAGCIGSQAVTQMVAAVKQPEQKKEEDKKETEVK